MRHLKIDICVCGGQGASSEAFLCDGGVTRSPLESKGASREKTTARDVSRATIQETSVASNKLEATKQEAAVAVEQKKEADARLADALD